MARWLLMLAEFELKYVTKKSIKGRAVAEFLADCPVKGGEDAKIKFPDEDIMTLAEDVWKLYFDGAANQKGFAISVLLIAPDRSHILLAFKLNFEVTNNQAEYEACIVGMEAAIKIGIEKLEVVRDSNLEVSQANGDWKVKEEKLKPYHQDFEDLIPHFNKVTFTHVPRLKNQFADALATLASMIEIPIGVKLRPIVIEQRDTPVYQHVAIDEPDDGHLWYYYIWRFVERGEYPIEASKKDKIALQRMVAQYIICGRNLYRRSHCGMHKLCIHGTEARRVMEETHEGVYGPHMKGMMLVKKILRQGYFWSAMETECVEYVRRCHKCQIHANLTHVPPSELHQMTSPWPFSYEVPQAFVSDNGVHFKGRAREILDEFQIQVHKSTTYRPQTNGAMDAANKTIKAILEKTIQSARDCHEQLPLALWGYRTSVRTPTGATPYSLVYGMEAVLPIKLEVPSLRTMVECEVQETEWLSNRFEELILFDERWLRALYHIQWYQRRIARAFNKKVRPRDLAEGDMGSRIESVFLGPGSRSNIPPKPLPVAPANHHRWVRMRIGHLTSSPESLIVAKNGVTKEGQDIYHNLSRGLLSKAKLTLNPIGNIESESL
ncbi:uncharacterized protein LOC131303068 [Rhododendron vialii]|uniref:uncharacterized protein LOC131303068 n=1 Tax=Rhododendron vialii TaxID=182163 RepID=UPI00265FFA3F|nr:uncharacterized protein LOC131303068 [Rhododendron vialii]